MIPDKYLDLIKGDLECIVCQGFVLSTGKSCYQCDKVMCTECHDAMNDKRGWRYGGNNNTQKLCPICSKPDSFKPLNRTLVKILENVNYKCNNFRCSLNKPTETAKLPY